MIPTQVPEPFHRDGWIYEEKVDSWRILAYKDGNRVRLVSRTGVEHSKRFRGIAEAVATLPFDTLVLDGEVAIFDEQLRSCFHWLRATPDELLTPPIYIAFDVLHRAGQDVTEHRYRTAACSSRTPSLVGGPTCCQRDARPTGVSTPGAQVLGSGFEGYVAEDQLSRYRGRVARSWLKFSCQAGRIGRTGGQSYPVGLSRRDSDRRGLVREP
jgi:bifunctional non-homologous end joining protein LigD